MSVNINWIAVLIAGASAFVVGGIWYGALFARRWQALVGLSDEEVASGRQRVFGGALVLSLVMALNLAFFIGAEGATFGLFAGLAAGVGWVAMAFGVNYLFERRPLALFLLNAGYNVITFALMGLIIGAMQTG